MNQDNIKTFTCFLAVVAVFNSSKYPGQTRLPDAVLAQEDHLVDLPVWVAAGRDDRVGGVGHAAVPVLVRRTEAPEAGLILGHRAQLPVVHRHAPPVQVLQVQGKRHATSPLVHVPQLVSFVQSHDSKPVCVKLYYNNQATVQRRFSITIKLIPRRVEKIWNHVKI